MGDPRYVPGAALSVRDRRLVECVCQCVRYTADARVGEGVYEAAHVDVEPVLGWIERALPDLDAAGAVALGTLTAHVAGERAEHLVDGLVGIVSRDSGTFDARETLVAGALGQVGSSPTDERLKGSLMRVAPCAFEGGARILDLVYALETIACARDLNQRLRARRAVGKADGPDKAKAAFQGTPVVVEDASTGDTGSGSGSAAELRELALDEERTERVDPTGAVDAEDERKAREARDREITELLGAYANKLGEWSLWRKDADRSEEEYLAWLDEWLGKLSESARDAFMDDMLTRRSEACGTREDAYDLLRRAYAFRDGISIDDEPKLRKTVERAVDEMCSIDDERRPVREISRGLFGDPNVIEYAMVRDDIVVPEPYEDTRLSVEENGVEFDIF